MGRFRGSKADKLDLIIAYEQSANSRDKEVLPIIPANDGSPPCALLERKGRSVIQRRPFPIPYDAVRSELHDLTCSTDMFRALYALGVERHPGLSNLHYANYLGQFLGQQSRW